MDDLLRAAADDPDLSQGQTTGRPSPFPKVIIGNESHGEIATAPHLSPHVRRRLNSCCPSLFFTTKYVLPSSTRKRRSRVFRSRCFPCASQCDFLGSKIRLKSLISPAHPDTRPHNQSGHWLSTSGCLLCAKSRQSALQQNHSIGSHRQRRRAKFAAP
jgi:hypothetical protein